jgi:thioredoxin reductase (NADPH)
MQKNVVIIGSGPSGLTAGIYTARAGYNTTIITGNQPGGQLTTTTEIENFPGAWSEDNKGILGPKLMQLMQKQAEFFGANIISDDAILLNTKREKNNFVVDTNFSGSLEADAIIIASGASARYLNLPDETNWIGRGYHTCATCDGFFYKDKIVAVIGGGDSAMEEASYLSKLAKKVYLIHRKDKFRASNIMQDRVNNNPVIEKIFDMQVVDFVIESDKIIGIQTKNLKNGEVKNIMLDGVFVAIGHVPNSGFVGNLLTKDQFGYLLSRKKLKGPKLALGEKVDMSWDKFQTMSELEGIFIAGDVEDSFYRQAVTAAGDGARAAIDAERWMEEN